MSHWRVLADAVLLVHFSIVLFVIAGLLLAPWVRARWFRIAHLAAIGFVVVQAWLGQVCPLTTLESWLRMRGGDAGYERGFIEHWVRGAMFFDAPAWAFTLAYTAFGALVALAWWRWPPQGRVR